MFQRKILFPLSVLRWIQNVPAKRWYSPSRIQHGVINQTNTIKIFHARLRTTNLCPKLVDLEHQAIQVKLADFLAVKIPWCKTKPSS